MVRSSRVLLLASVFLALAAFLPAIAAATTRTVGGTRVYYAVTSDTDTSAKADPTQGIYWINASGLGARHRLSSRGASVNQPYGVAIDPVRGYVYWANYVGGQISRAALDGSGSGRDLFQTGTKTGPVGIAIDPAHAAIYWSQYTPPGSIQRGALNGSGKPSTVKLAGATANAPCDLSMDTASMILYWANCGLTGHGKTITMSELGNGNKTSAISLAGAFADEVNGVAVDSAAGMAYWVSYAAKNADKVLGRVPLAGGGAANLALSGGGKPVAPEGMALDPTTGTIYWANGTIQRTATGGATSTLSTRAVPANDYVGYMALLAPPRSIGAPAITGGTTAGSTLTCSKGGWDAGMPSAHYFDAAASYGYAWTMNGTPIIGAMKSTFTTSTAGSYACTVEASNEAGSTTATSAAVTIG